MAGIVGKYATREAKTRKRTGSIVALVHEHYLRDDLGCSSAICDICSQERPRLPATSHYLIPDAKAILDYLELLELPQLIGVIYLASVVQDVHERGNQRTYSRLRALYSDPRRQNLFFDDQHHAGIWRMQREHLKGFTKSFTKNKGVAASGDKGKLFYRQQKLQVAAEWFARHLNGKAEIVIVSNEYEYEPPKTSIEGELNGLLEPMAALNLEPTQSQDCLPTGVKLMGSSQYFQRYWGEDRSVMELHDSLIQAQEAAAAEEALAPAEVRKSGGLYKEHLPGHAVDEGVREGALQIGIFHVSSHSPLEGFVRWSNHGEAALGEVFVPDRTLQNRAIAGDVVAVRVLPPAQWRARGANKDRGNRAEGEVAGEESSAAGGAPSDDAWDLWEEADAEEDFLKADQNLHEQKVPTGEIVRVIQRAQRDYVACLREDDEQRLSERESLRQEALLCIPMDRCIPLVRVRTRQGARLFGQRFVLRIDGWERASAVPHGHVVRVLGPMGDLGAECSAVLVENGIIDSPFTAGALNELPTEAPWRIPQEELRARRDLRKLLFTCSIDPPGSKDVDDALSLHFLPNGLIEVGVHIADVSYFVKADSLLDLEARSRSTTVYLVDRRLNMLPELLSEDLCSLRGGEERLAVSVLWTVDPERSFRVASTCFGRTVILSRYQMVYEQAQMILDNQKLPAEWQLPGGDSEVLFVKNNLTVLAAFAQELRERREESGGLQLSSAELRFELNEKREPVRVQSKKEILMNRVVAEFMIAANASVAQQIYEAFPSAALLRRHPAPREDSFRHLAQYCMEQSIELDTSSNKALAESLERLHGKVEGTVEAAVKAMATRAMSEAEYFCTGLVADSDSIRHYGLGLKFYTHFTSPIRRYADVVVHRILMASLQQEDMRSSSLREESERVEGRREGVSRRLLPAPLGDSRKTGLLPTEELHKAGAHMNARQRASKAAQKTCSRRALLLYLTRHVHTDRAVVKKVQANGLLLFIPNYDLQGMLFAKDLPSGTALHNFRPLQALWVQLSAEESRVRGPSLRVSLLPAGHPAAMAGAARPAVNGSQREHSFMATAKLVLGLRGPPPGDGLKQTDRNESGTARKEDLESSRAGEETTGTAGEEFETMHDVVASFTAATLEDSSLFSETEARRSPSRMASKGGGSAHVQVLFASPTAKEVVSLTFSASGPVDVGEEGAKEAAMRKRWLHVLAKAAIVRARRSRSFLAEDDIRQVRRGLTESQARERAKRVGERWLRMDGIRHN